MCALSEVLLLCGRGVSGRGFSERSGSWRGVVAAVVTVVLGGIAALLDREAILARLLPSSLGGAM